MADLTDLALHLAQQDAQDRALAVSALRRRLNCLA